MSSPSVFTEVQGGTASWQAVLKTAEGTGFFKVVIFSVLGNSFLLCGVTDFRRNDAVAEPHMTSIPVRSGDRFAASCFWDRRRNRPSSSCHLLSISPYGGGDLQWNGYLPISEVAPHVMVTSVTSKRDYFGAPQYLDRLPYWTRKLGLSLGTS